jgi:pyridoxine kinase
VTISGSAPRWLSIKNKKVKTPYTLAVSSFAVHGTASLKTFITLLGEKILPVPSLLLNGLTNMSLVQKFATPFEELMRGTFDLAADRDLDLILYIGYLGNAGQADIILKMIETHRSRIKTIITDPVCGDHGRKYVPDEVIARWPEIISVSDMVFPNLTEIRILTGHEPDDGYDEIYIEQFQKLFPATHLVVTSIKTGEGTIGIRSYGKEHFSYSHPILPKNYGGSGDAFLALFIQNHFYKRHSFNDALKLAADQTRRIIKNSIDMDSDDLLLEYRNLVKFKRQI